MRLLCRNNEESPSCRPDTGREMKDNNQRQVKKTKKINNGKGDDPLNDPQIRRSLIELNITGPQLIEMSVKELNKRLISCPQSTIDMLKRCRRTLKNRGYAKSCRVKRIAAKNQLEYLNKRLARENRDLKQRNRSLSEQVVELQNKITHQEKQSIVSEQSAPMPTLINCNQEGYKQDLKREAAVAEQDSELRSLYEFIDTLYPAGVELDQIVQSIVADEFLLQSYLNV